MKKFRLVSGVVLAFVGLLLVVASTSVSLGTVDKFFLYFFGWILFVVGYLSVVEGAATAIDAWVSMKYGKDLRE